MMFKSRYIVIAVLFSVFSFVACQNEKADKNNQETTEEAISEEKLEAEKTQESHPIDEDVSLIGTWVRSFEIDNQILEFGFTLNEDQTVEIIKEKDDMSQYWTLPAENILQFIHKNRSTGDTTITKTFEIIHHYPTELVLTPEGRDVNYRDYYTRK